MPQTVTLTMNLIDGNNFINAAEVASGITISGTASDSGGASDITGQTVSVSFNGNTYTGAVTSTGNWSVSIPASALAALADNTKYLASASVTDTLGNSGTAAHTATVDETVALTMNVVDGNNYIDGNEYTNGITINGTANDSIGLNGVVGRTVSVTFNGQTYTGTVSSTGTWSVSVPASATSALVDGGKYLATAKITDYAGNLAASVHNVTVDLKTYLVVNPIGANPSGNNSYINASLIASGITIGGTATDDIGETGVAGRTVTVTLNGKSYTGTISSAGTWSVNVGTADLSALTDGTVYNVVAAYSDWAGNNVSENRFVTVDKTASLAINPIDGNNYINGTNVADGITITGTTTGSLGSGDATGQMITLTLNGKSYTGTVASNGTWSVSVDSTDLSALTDGDSYTVAASGTDKAGNLISSTDMVTVDKAATIDVNLVDGDNFITAANIASGITISGVADGSAGLADVSGQTVTLTLNGKNYTGTIASDGAWSMNVDSADLTALSDKTTYSLVATGTDAAGNAMSYTDQVTVHQTAVNWGSTSGDWGTATNWQGDALPTSTDLASLNLTSGETVTFSTSTGNSTVDGILLSGAGTLDLTGDTLTVFHNILLEGGTLELDSGATLQGATIINTGGTIDLNGGTLDNATIDGTMNLSTSNYSAYIAGGLMVTGPNGYGPGTINLTGISDILYFEGNQTLDNATVTLGTTTGGNDIVYNDDTNNTGSVLTLGKNLIINDNLYNNTYLASSGYRAAGDGIVNDGTINVAVGFVASLESLYISSLNFTNNGTINVAAGSTINLKPNNDLVNAADGEITINPTGSLFFGDGSNTASNAGTITAYEARQIDFYNLTNTGTLNITNSPVYLYGTYGTSFLTAFSGDKDTFYIEGTLNNASQTITVGTGSALGALILVSTGTISGGTIIDQGSGISFGGGTFDGVTYDGAMDLSYNNSSVYIVGGLTTHAQNGTGAGTINLTGISDDLFFEGNQTVDDAVISFGFINFLLGSGANGIFSDDTGTGSVLTLGPNLTINDTSPEYSYNYIGSLGTDNTGDGIINNGTINVDGNTNTRLDIQPYNFTNNGTITVSSGGTLLINPSTSLTNAAGANITLGSGGVLTFGDSTAISSNAGTITASDATVDLYNFTNTGTLNITNSAIFLYGNYITSFLNNFAGDTDTIAMEDTLNNTSQTLTVGTGAALPEIILEPGGTITGGTIIDQGSGVSFQGGTLNAVTYNGTINVSAAGDTVDLTGGVTIHAQNGTSPGAIIITGANDTIGITGGLTSNGGSINLTGTGDALYFDGSQTLDDATITLGSATAYNDSLDNDDIDGTGSVLTLGANLTINANSQGSTGADYLGSTGTDVSGDGIVNNGTINVEGTNNTKLYINPYNFTNAGTINVASNAALYLEPATSLTNDTTGNITINGGSATFGIGTDTISNAGNISIKGGSAVFGNGSGTVSNSGNITVNSGGTLTFGNSTNPANNTGTITATGATVYLYSVTNTGTLDITDSTVYLYGTYSTSLLSQFANDTIYMDGTLDNASTLTVGTGSTLGDIVLGSTGTIAGGTIVDQGGGVAFQGGTLQGVTYDGTMNLSLADASLYITDGLTLKGQDGTGAGTLNITGSSDSMYFDGSQTLDDATITLGSASTYNDSLNNDDTDGTGSVLTLGANLTINVDSQGSSGSDYLGSTGTDASGDGIINDGTINVEGTNSSNLYIDAYNFINEGTINVASSATLALGGSNAGTITVDNATVEFDSLNNSGTINITNSTLYLSGSSLLLLNQFADQGNSIRLEGGGVVNNTSQTLTVGPGGEFQQIVLTAAGTISGGTIVDYGSGMSFWDGTLNSVTYDGTMTITSPIFPFPGVTIENGLTVHAQNGSGPGVINVTGQNSEMTFEGTQTFDNANITLGNTTSFSNFIYNYDKNGTGSLLTFGSNMIINVNSSNHGYFESSGSYETGDGIVNDGVININSNCFIESFNFTNQGNITVNSGGTLIIAPSIGFNNAGTFTNSGTLADNGGNISVDAAETGTGNATISGTGEITYEFAATDNITFESSSTGTLVLDDAPTFTGTITGFAGTGTPATSDKIDLTDISFATLTASYASNVLTVSDGTHTANITFVGSYVPGDFSFANDGSGGTLVYDPPVASTSASTNTTALKLVQSMASFGAETGPAPIINNLEPHVIMASNVANPVQLHH